MLPVAESVKSHLRGKDVLAIAKLLGVLDQHVVEGTIFQLVVSNLLLSAVLTRRFHAGSMSLVELEDIAQRHHIVRSIGLYHGIEVHFHVVGLDIHDVESVPHTAFTALELIHVVGHFNQ